VSIGGAVLMLLSVPVYARRPLRAVLAEALTLLGVIAAGELLWLAPALVVMYAAWILDWQLGHVKSTDGASLSEEPPSPAGRTRQDGSGAGGEGSSPSGAGNGGHVDAATPSQGSAAVPAAFWPYFYPVLAIAGAAVIGVKLIGHGLPYHMVMF
jgi:hypothetical protein